MFKKSINLVVMIMVLGIFGLTACNNVSLADYKATKSQALQDYADAKSEANSYCTEGLAAISAAVTDGKAEIAKATSNRDVDTAYNDAKGVIDAIPEEDEEVAEIATIHFYTSKTMVLMERHQFYDFFERTYSTKTIEEYDGWDGVHDEYAVVATFTEEKVAEFLLNAKKQGLFLLKEFYTFDDNTSVNNSWSLSIEFKDGTTFTSGGFFYPDSASELDELFLQLSGYKLFGI